MFEEFLRQISSKFILSMGHLIVTEKLLVFCFSLIIIKIMIVIRVSRIDIVLRVHFALLEIEVLLLMNASNESMPMLR